MQTSVEQLVRLQQKTDQIRNVCVLAHVDHGKTTLSDHLIASNGLIHPRLAGELRYMDSKEEEQARGITMKSSSISLLHIPHNVTGSSNHSLSDADKEEHGYLINLIDSPGHVDFCSEVSTAARLSDGAFVVVDAVEGVCIQTHAVLRQAWEEKVSLCLVLNKIDRLILELRLTPQEAYERMAAIIVHVNMIISSFHSERFLSEADSVLAYEDARAATDAEAAERREQELEDEEIAGQFSPEKGNVAFASAHDGWAFRLGQFAEMYAVKIGCNASALTKALWGDYAFSAKTKRIVKIKDDQRGKLKPLFVQLALEPIWKVYSVCDSGEPHAPVLSKMISSLGLTTVGERAINQTEPRSAVRAVLRAWLPLAEAVLGMAVEHLPSPKEAAPERISRLLPNRTAALKGYIPSPELDTALEAQETAISSCDTSEEAPCVVYISKMVAVPASALPRSPGEPGPLHPNEERFLAFGRVFSGRLKSGHSVYVLPSTYNPAAATEISGGAGATAGDTNSNETLAAQQSQQAVVQAAYLMMGRGLERLPEVPAGNVLAILGLDTAILKSATVSTTPLCRPLAPMLFQSAPIVRVAVEPAHPGEMNALNEGLRLLHKADPMVEIEIQDTGEHVICAAGEVHLETCIKDLKERFAKIELHVSPPLVAFRESVYRAEEGGEAGISAGGGQTGLPVGKSHAAVVEATTPGGACTVRVKVKALPASVASLLDGAEDELKMRLVGQSVKGDSASSHAQQQHSNNNNHSSSSNAVGTVTSNTATDTNGTVHSSLSSKLKAAAASEPDSKKLESVLSRIWMLGPKRLGPNILLASNVDTSGITKEQQQSLWQTPEDKVIKVAKQASRMPHIASIGSSLATAQHADNNTNTTGGLNGENMAVSVDGEQQQQIRSIPVALGRPEVSQRLGLAGTDVDQNHQTQTAASQLADRIASLSVNESQEEHNSTTIGAGGSLLSSEYLQHSIESGVAAGFQLASAQGPLCDEPMWGVVFDVQVQLNILLPTGSSASLDSSNAMSDLGKSLLQEDVYGPFSGQVTSTVRQALRRAVMESGPRLVEAAFLCEISTSAEGLAAVYAVLGRRRARVLREELREGSGLFSVHAYLPAEASFGFVEELRRKSSGAAAASLMLSHWERLHVDPFFVPTTEEEREEFGEEGQGVGAPNLARKLIDVVRRRKGLAVEEKVVEVATKQRTRARKV